MTSLGLLTTITSLEKFQAISNLEKVKSLVEIQKSRSHVPCTDTKKAKTADSFSLTWSIKTILQIYG